jgi:hypothetical protein
MIEDAIHKMLGGSCRIQRNRDFFPLRLYRRRDRLYCTIQASRWVPTVSRLSLNPRPRVRVTHSVRHWQPFPGRHQNGTES